MTEQMTDRNRWIALYVLCVGMLMIVLDVTVVNVALPSIQDDLGFSQSSLAWVVNAYLIAFGGLLLLSGRLRRPPRAQERLPGRPGRLHGRLAAVRRGAEPGAARRGALHPGRRRRDDVRRDPRHDRDDVPRAARAGEGDRHLRVRRVRRRLDRPARRRRADRVDQLALDLLRQHPDRHRHGGPRRAAARAGQGHRLRLGRRLPRRGADHELADAARLHDRQAGGRGRLGLGQRARARRARARAARRLRRARGALREPADAAADLPLAQRCRART